MLSHFRTDGNAFLARRFFRRDEDGDEVWLRLGGRVCWSGRISLLTTARCNAAVSAAVLRASRPQKAMARTAHLTGQDSNGGQDAPHTAGKIPAVQRVILTLARPGSTGVQRNRLPPTPSHARREKRGLVPESSSYYSSCIEFFQNNCAEGKETPANLCIRTNIEEDSHDLNTSYSS